MPTLAGDMGTLIPTFRTATASTRFWSGCGDPTAAQRIWSASSSASHAPKLNAVLMTRRLGSASAVKPLASSCWSTMSRPRMRTRDLGTSSSAVASSAPIRSAVRGSAPRAHAVVQMVPATPLTAQSRISDPIFTTLSASIAPVAWGRLMEAPRFRRTTLSASPARAGDALKVVLLNRGASISLPQATGAMLADKVVNIGSLILLCAVSGVAGTIWTTAWARGALPLTALLIGALLATALLLVPKSRVRILGRLIVLQHELARGFTALADPKRLVISTAFSFGAWLAELLALQILCAAVGSPQPLQNLVLAVAVLNVGISVPMSPANVGIYEMALAFGLSRAGLPGPAALAVATVHHGIQLLAVNVAAAALTLWASALSSPTT